jgi:CMP-N,N'-diacetyllegionaminic acid synthase
MKNIIAIIPARGGSKGIKNKNLAKVGGYPLLAYPIMCAKMSLYIKRVIVDTDCPNIAKVAARFGAETPYLRPAELATDTATDLDWARHAVEWLQTHDQPRPDLLVHLRTTTPLRNPENVDSAIAYFLQSPEATSLRSVHTLQESPYKMFIKDGEYLKPFMQYGDGEFYNLPRQHFPTVYFPNGYVDILRPEIIMGGSLHGGKIVGYETEKVTEVDGPDNLLELNRNFSHNPVHIELLENFWVT